MTKNSYQLSVISCQLRKTEWYLLILIPLFTVYCSLFLSPVYAETPVDITADYLEHDTKTNTYFAKGSVKLIQDDSTLKADEIHLNNTTGDSVATGNVTFEDKEIFIKTDKIEFNLITKLGTIYNSSIFYKRRNYHIEGGTLQRLGEKTFSMDKASATTCDAVPPEWHFTGRDIKITLQKNITARNATFYIKNIPVLYTPYFLVPLLKDRQTGLLLPVFGYSSTKGFTYKQPFYWAIKDNMDATLYADYFSEKGIGKGLDYRYIAGDETNGELWMYHLGDNDLSRDFFELKSYHNQKLPYGMSGYLKLHYVNEFDYYTVMDSTSSKRIGLSTWESDPFGFASEERLQKYLESNLQISKPFSGGRTYLLGQYRESLEGSSGTIPQSLPELGFAVNTKNIIGNASFNMEVKGTNFWKDSGQQGQRLDIYPNVYLSMGRTVNLTQKIGLRETQYFLKNPADNLNRAIFDLNSSLTTRFLKRYSSFIHSIEPSIEYTYMPYVDQSDIPVFDSIDSLPKTSDVYYTFTNRIAGSALGGSEARLRVSQHYNLLDSEEPFSHVLFETTLSSQNMAISINASYDVYDKYIAETFGSIYLKNEKGFIGIGKNFRRSTSLDQYSVEAGINKPIEIFGRSLPLDITGRLLYDMKGGGMQEFKIKSIYSRQCWNLTLSYTRKPNEYQIMIGIEFKGFGAIKIG
ncbi:MAG: LPS assembly protein LptD [Nitrospirota bacterium]